ncbi:MAG: hypothetical protein FJZ75_04385 [Bacteroidetes bacterium]|nr:hypothetical protein [Bacteroidota bacterium]
MGALDFECGLGGLETLIVFEGHFARNKRPKKIYTAFHVGVWPSFRSLTPIKGLTTLAWSILLLLEVSTPLKAQDSLHKARLGEHTFRFAVSGQGSFSKNWQGELQAQNIWVLNAQIEPTLVWRSGRWSFQIPILLEGQAVWIPDSLYSVGNDRLIVGSKVGWRLAGHDSLPHSLHLEFGKRLETRWLPKPWLQKLRSYSKGKTLESDYQTEPYLLNPGIVFLSFGLTCRLWTNLRVHAGLAGAKLNFVLNRFSGADSSFAGVWGIEPMGANPHIKWGWNSEVHWEKKGKHRESYLLQAQFFSPPEGLQFWSGRAKAELNFPLYKGLSLGWQAQWSYEPAQFHGHQWQQSVFLRFGAEFSP